MYDEILKLKKKIENVRNNRKQINQLQDELEKDLDDYHIGCCRIEKYFHELPEDIQLDYLLSHQTRRISHNYFRNTFNLSFKNNHHSPPTVKISSLYLKSMHDCIVCADGFRFICGYYDYDWIETVVGGVPTFIFSWYKNTNIAMIRHADDRRLIIRGSLVDVLIYIYKNK